MTRRRAGGHFPGCRVSSGMVVFDAGECATTPECLKSVVQKRKKAVHACASLLGHRGVNFGKVLDGLRGRPREHGAPLADEVQLVEHVVDGRPGGRAEGGEALPPARLGPQRPRETARGPVCPSVNTPPPQKKKKKRWKKKDGGAVAAALPLLRVPPWLVDGRDHGAARRGEAPHARHDGLGLGGAAGSGKKGSGGGARERWAPVRREGPETLREGRVGGGGSFGRRKKKKKNGTEKNKLGERERAHTPTGPPRGNQPGRSRAPPGGVPIV